MNNKINDLNCNLCLVLTKKRDIEREECSDCANSFEGRSRVSMYKDSMAQLHRALELQELDKEKDGAQ